MLLPRLQPPLRAAVSVLGRSATPSSSSSSAGLLNEAFAQLTIRPSAASSLVFVRHASHNQQGAVNKAKDGAGKRLGAKKSGEQYVIPGNIIFRQRGTLWFPGENCAMGRDHTIYATEHGYVKYYKDPDKHPKRQYIGVTFKRDQVLPLPRNSQRRRRLGMEATKMEVAPTIVAEPVIEEARSDLVAAADGSTSVVTTTKIKKIKYRRGEEGRNLTLRPGYMYREANWQIGRAAERAKVKVRAFKPGDRWTAWRKATIRSKTIEEKKGLARKTGKSGKSGKGGKSKAK